MVDTVVDSVDKCEGLPFTEVAGQALKEEEMGVYLSGRKRITAVPQVGQAPFAAGRPFFVVTCFAFVMSRWARHLTQYPFTSIWSLTSFLCYKAKT